MIVRLFTNKLVFEVRSIFGSVVGKQRGATYRDWNEQMLVVSSLSAGFLCLRNSHSTAIYSILTNAESILC
jgi:hypothetical protein